VVRGQVGDQVAWLVALQVEGRAWHPLASRQGLIWVVQKVHLLEVQPVEHRLVNWMVEGLEGQDPELQQVWLQRAVAPIWRHR